ncbi:1-acyl-sn-glycerol-3-phosphate acyltransferase, partial [Staphylococcus shinii]
MYKFISGLLKFIIIKLSNSLEVQG